MSQIHSQETVARLKELLFDREARELDTLNSRLADMQERAGSDEQFQRSVARVLDSALRDAEATRHRELAEAMAPMVLRTLRAEMRSPDMQDQITGVMYPRMGEMVGRYVSSAIRDMMQEINRRLEAGLSHNRFFLWMRSVASGRSMAELALAETQRLEVEEIYLVRRGSGALVHHWRRPGSSDVPDGDNRDTLVSGFLAAITALAEEAFEADKDSLRTLDLDDHRIYLRGSPDYLLAAKCTGSAPAGIDRNLDGELLRVLDEQLAIEREANASTDAASERRAMHRRDLLLGDFSTNIEEAARERTREASRAHGGRTLKVLLWMIGLPLAGFAAWYFYVSFVTQALQVRANGVVAGISELKGYPVRAHVERGGRRIWVAGLAPDEATRRLVLGRLKEMAPEIELSEAIGVLPKSDVKARLDAEGFRRSLVRAQRKLTASIADLVAMRERSTGSPETEALAGAEQAAKAALAELEQPRPDVEGDRSDAAISRVLEDLEVATERLASLSGAEASPRSPVSQDATSSAEAISLASDRVVALLATIEQRRAVVPIAKRIDAVDETVAARTAEVDRLASERVAALDRRYRERLLELESRLSALAPPPPTARQKLETFAKSHVIFFTVDTEFRDAAETTRVLDELASLARETNAVIRVVGYTDEAGGASRNAPLAQARAERVVAGLASRGVSPENLIAVGRPNAAPLAPGTGPDSPNRRAEFELGFHGERGRRP